MTIQTTCPHCGSPLGLKETLVGKKVRCPKCMEPFAVPKPVRSSGGLTRTCPECDGKVPVNESRCPECGANYRRALQHLEHEADDGGAFAPERKAMNAGVLGGIILIAIAVVWFALGWVNGWIFYYPPVLLVLGLFTLFKGLATGNLAGHQPTRRRRTGTAHRSRRHQRSRTG